MVLEFVFFSSVVSGHLVLTKCTLNRIYVREHTRKASDLATEIIKNTFIFSAFKFVHETFTSN